MLVIVVMMVMMLVLVLVVMPTKKRYFEIVLCKDISCSVGIWIMIRKKNDRATKTRYSR